ncbi:hypothetical protein [Tardiphaga sp.]|jgi:hypothetical protein|uniref:hypothetical protein n=1 Tax=Tardiphaga sp. TaxID=1926292 RepID=UPI0037D9D737
MPLGKQAKTSELRPNVAMGKILQPGRHILISKVTVFLDLAGNVSRDISRPVLGSVEGYNGERVRILAAHQVGDNRLEVSAVDVGFSPDTAS